MKKQLIESMLEKLYFVKWDRFIDSGFGQFDFYGWIPRDEWQGKEPRYDFIVLSRISDNWWWITSSAKWSKDIHQIIQGTTEGHVDCKRVEDSFKITNSIILKK